MASMGDYARDLIDTQIKVTDRKRNYSFHELCKSELSFNLELKYHPECVNWFFLVKYH
jgi:hypothetical protein